MKPGLIFAALIAVLTPHTFAQESAAPKTEDQKILYTVGVWLGQQAAPFNLTASELKYVQTGLKDSIQGKKPVVNTDIYGPKLNDFARSRMQARANEEKQKGASVLTKEAQKKGAVKTTDGLIYLEEKRGSGASPKETDKVKVHYEGRLADGTVFDSSIARGTPAEFTLNQVIPCWKEGVQMMKVGGKARLVCPSDIAYGDRGMPPRIPGGSVLIFEIELLDIAKK